MSIPEIGTCSRVSHLRNKGSPCSDSVQNSNQQGHYTLNTSQSDLHLGRFEGVMWKDL